LQHNVDNLGYPLRLPVNIDDTTEEEAKAIIHETNSQNISVLITYLSRAEEIVDFSKYLGINIVQLHGDIGYGELEKIKKLQPDLQIIKSLVIGLLDEDEIEKIIHYSYPFVDYFITDTFNPKNGASGATGLTHDWKISREIVEISPKPVILAGGLNPCNVAEAIKFVRPAGVDAHTGVEDSNGNKNLELVVNFVKNAKAAFVSLSDYDMVIQENSDTLDLHNFHPKDVHTLVHDFIDTSLEKGHFDIRIIHGKGIGVLRDIVHAELEKNEHVQSYKLANDRFSSWGATVVKLTH